MPVCRLCSSFSLSGGNESPRTTIATMQTVSFKGTDTMATVLAVFGKIKTNDTKAFTLEISALETTLASVKVAATPTKEEKDQALATLTDAERSTLTRLQNKVSAHAKQLAEKRVAGQTAERWTTTGQATLV